MFPEFLQKNLSLSKLAKAFTVNPILPAEELGIPLEYQSAEVSYIKSNSAKSSFLPTGESIYLAL